jgi:hypothetical protein
MPGSTPGPCLKQLKEPSRGSFYFYIEVTKTCSSSLSLRALPSESKTARVLAVNKLSRPVLETKGLPSKIKDLVLVVVLNPIALPLEWVS